MATQGAYFDYSFVYSDGCMAKYRWGATMELERFDLSLPSPAYPMSLYWFPKATMEGVCLRLASLVMISTTPLSTAAILVYIDPRSIPETDIVNCDDWLVCIY